MSLEVSLDRQSTPFRLLDLPPELWSRICKLAVVDRNPVYIIHSTSAQSSYHQPPITRVNRAIREECLPDFYACNLFFTYVTWSHPEAVSEWFFKQACANAELISRLGKLYLICKPTLPWYVSIRDCGGYAQSNGLLYGIVSDEDWADVLKFGKDCWYSVLLEDAPRMRYLGGKERLGHDWVVRVVQARAPGS